MLLGPRASHVSRRREVGEAMNWDRKLIAENVALGGTTDLRMDYSIAGAQWMRRQLRTDESVTQLADFLYEYDHRETLAQHVAICWRPDDCSVRDSYTRCARAVITALLGEEP